MLPEMDVRKITETRIGKRGEQGLREINLTEQGKISSRLGDLNFRQPGQRRERRPHLHISQN